MPAYPGAPHEDPPLWKSCTTAAWALTCVRSSASYSRSPRQNWQADATRQKARERKRLTRTVSTLRIFVTTYIEYMRVAYMLHMSPNHATAYMLHYVAKSCGGSNSRIDKWPRSKQPPTSRRASGSCGSHRPGSTRR